MHVSSQTWSHSSSRMNVFHFTLYPTFITMSHTLTHKEMVSPMFCHSYTEQDGEMRACREK